MTAPSPFLDRAVTRHWGQAVEVARGLLDGLPRWVGARHVGELEPTAEQLDVLLGRARRSERRAKLVRVAVYWLAWVGAVVVGVESSSWMGVCLWWLFALGLYGWVSRGWISCVDVTAQIEQQERLAGYGVKLEVGLRAGLAARTKTSGRLDV